MTYFSGDDILFGPSQSNILEHYVTMNYILAERRFFPLIACLGWELFHHSKLH